MKDIKIMLRLENKNVRIEVFSETLSGCRLIHFLFKRTDVLRVGYVTENQLNEIVKAFEERRGVE